MHTPAREPLLPHGSRRDAVQAENPATLWTVCCAGGLTSPRPGYPERAHTTQTDGRRAERPRDSQKPPNCPLETHRPTRRCFYNSYLSGPACPRSPSWATPTPPSAAGPGSPAAWTQPPVKRSSGCLLWWARTQTGGAVGRKEGERGMRGVRSPGGSPSALPHTDPELRGTDVTCGLFSCSGSEAANWCYEATEW